MLLDFLCKFTFYARSLRFVSSCCLSMDSWYYASSAAIPAGKTWRREAARIAVCLPRLGFQCLPGRPSAAAPSLLRDHDPAATGTPTDTRTTFRGSDRHCRDSGQTNPSIRTNTRSVGK
jgi:hypothetical protein